MDAALPYCRTLEFRNDDKYRSSLSSCALLGQGDNSSSISKLFPSLEQERDFEYYDADCKKPPQQDRFPSASDGVKINSPKTLVIIHPVKVKYFLARYEVPCQYVARQPRKPAVVRRPQRVTTPEVIPISRSSSGTPAPRP